MSDSDEVTSSMQELAPKSGSTTPTDHEYYSNENRPSLYHVDCEHCHHGNGRDLTHAKRKLLLSCVICAIFIVCEVVGGIISNSLAIAGDASHMLSDLASYIVGWIALWLSERPPTETLQFGFYRAEILGALVSILIIWCVTGILFYVSIERIVNNVFDLDAEVMLIIGCLGMLANIVLGLVLHLNCGRHEEGSKHSHTNISVKAAVIHVVGDFFQSIGVLIAAVLIYLNPKFKLADPICTIIFCIIVLITTLKIMRDILRVLMEGTPEGIDLKKVRETILSIPGVVDIYNLRIWALTMEKAAIAVHIAISKGHNPLVVLKEATTRVRRLNFFEMTLQIEEISESGDKCKECETVQSDEY